MVMRPGKPLSRFPCKFRARHSVLVPGRNTVNMVWNNRVSHGIRTIGYDISTGTMEIIFSDDTVRYYGPVPYSLYTGFAHATFPDRFYRHTIEGKIPLIINT